MWFDTHTHLNSTAYSATGETVNQLIHTARLKGVSRFIIPSTTAETFNETMMIAHHAHHQEYDTIYYAVGLHPCCLDKLNTLDAENIALNHLKQHLLNHKNKDNTQLIAIGEIGLDFFINPSEFQQAQQLRLFKAQLKLAQTYDLPVIIHSRKANDVIAHTLRQIHVKGGVIHAFNGSLQQANTFIQLGFKLGFGGASTYSRALNLRRLWCELPLNHLVLETDSPDMPPAFIDQALTLNKPEYLPQIGTVLATLKNIPPEVLAYHTTYNALTLFNI